MVKIYGIAFLCRIVNWVRIYVWLYMCITKFCLCWGLTSQSTIFQSCRDGVTASWVINQYFPGVKCLAQGHNTAAVGFEPPTSRPGVRHSTTGPPRSPASQSKCHLYYKWSVVNRKKKQKTKKKKKKQQQKNKKKQNKKQTYMILIWFGLTGYTTIIFLQTTMLSNRPGVLRLERKFRMSLYLAGRKK